MVVATLGAGVWYFGLRETAPPSAFVRAYDRLSAAAGEVRSGAEHVARFLDLPNYQQTADAQVEVMKKQTKVFERLAAKEGDNDRGRIARDAAEAAKRGTFAAREFSGAVIGRRLTTANRANGDLGAALADLARLVDEWEVSK